MFSCSLRSFRQSRVLLKWSSFALSFIMMTSAFNCIFIIMRTFPFEGRIQKLYKCAGKCSCLLVALSSHEKYYGCSSFLSITFPSCVSCEKCEPQATEDLVFMLLKNIELSCSNAVCFQSTSMFLISVKGTWSTRNVCAYLKGGCYDVLWCSGNYVYHVL
jgi:hypothetical protein